MSCGEVELCLKVEISIFVSAAVDESSPLTRHAVGELVRNYMQDGSCSMEDLVDRVTIEQVVADPVDDQTPAEELVRVGLLSDDVIGSWNTPGGADAAPPR